VVVGGRVAVLHTSHIWQQSCAKPLNSSSVVLWREKGLDGTINRPFSSSYVSRGGVFFLASREHNENRFFLRGCALWKRQVTWMYST